MWKKMTALVFAAAILAATVVPILGTGGVASANHPPGPPEKCTIVHNGKEKTLPHQAAEKHLAKHAGDYNVNCP